MRGLTVIMEKIKDWENQKKIAHGGNTRFILPAFMSHHSYNPGVGTSHERTNDAGFIYMDVFPYYNIK